MFCLHLTWWLRQEAMAIEAARVPLLKTDGYRIPSGSGTAGILANLGASETANWENCSGKHPDN